MSRLSVLHVHSGNLYGGIETVLATLVRESATADSAVHHFALCFEGRLADELRGLGAPVRELGAARLSRPDSVRGARLALGRTAGEVNPDVVLTHLPWTHAVFGRTLKRARRPVVQWVHGPIEGVVGSLARWTLPDALICNSAHTREGLAAPYQALPSETIFYPLSAPPPYDDASRAATRAALSTSPADVVIVQASRLEPWKGHREHLRALGRLADLPGWVAWIVGGAQRPSEAAYLRDLQELARSLRIGDRVRFVGEQQDVARFMAAADVYCQPNIGPEPFGMTYVEALQSGLPVIASRSGAVPEIVDGQTGVLVAAGDIAALADAIGGLIEHGARREDLSRAAPARARALCDPSRQIARLGAYLGQVVARSAA